MARVSRQNYELHICSLTSELSWPCHLYRSHALFPRLLGVFNLHRVWGRTTPEPRFIHTMVREGFPVQAQLKIASDPRSTWRDWGSAAILGPTSKINTLHLLNKNQTTTITVIVEELWQLFPQMITNTNTGPVCWTWVAGVFSVVAL